MDPKVKLVWEALLNETEIRVRTASREFEGRVWEIYKSPFGPHIGARVVDDEGRVHHFKVTNDDAEIEGS